MKLTTKYIRMIAKRDKRIEIVEIVPGHQVTVWLDPQWTWCANDGNITCMTYDVEGADDEWRSNVETFLEDIKNIEPTQE
jgi:hypothetical protein